MEAIAATFTRAGDAFAAVRKLQERGLEKGRTTLLLPGSEHRPLEEKVVTDDTEAPGVGGAIGGVVGGAVGLATVSLLVPGVGPVLVAGLVAGGLAGAAGGHAVGRQAEREMSLGMTHDELEVYGQALREGRTVVIAGGSTAAEADDVRDVLQEAGAERIDPAREDWLVGLRGDD